MILPDFSRTEDRATPFPHFRVAGLLSEECGLALLDWLDASAPWNLRIAEFYEQHEFSLLQCDLPAELTHLASAAFVAQIAHELSERLRCGSLELVEVAVHRLVQGQTIRIHNDFIGPTETHRLVVQINRGWSVENGGLLMIFKSDDPESVTDVLLPTHRSAFGFEISDRSHHAVSTINHGSRDSLVYTFRKAT